MIEPKRKDLACGGGVVRVRRERERGCGVSLIEDKARTVQVELLRMLPSANLCIVVDVIPTLLAISDTDSALENSTLL